MAIASGLVIRQIYGINSNVTDNLAFSDDETVVYVAGHSIVGTTVTRDTLRLRNVDRPTLRYVFTICALSASRKL